MTSRNFHRSFENEMACYSSNFTNKLPMMVDVGVEIEQRTHSGDEIGNRSQCPLPLSMIPIKVENDSMSSMSSV